MDNSTLASREDQNRDGGPVVCIVSSVPEPQKSDKKEQIETRMVCVVWEAERVDKSERERERERSVRGFCTVLTLNYTLISILCCACLTLLALIQGCVLGNAQTKTCFIFVFFFEIVWVNVVHTKSSFSIHLVWPLEYESNIRPPRFRCHSGSPFSLFVVVFVFVSFCSLQSFFVHPSHFDLGFANEPL